MSTDTKINWLEGLDLAYSVSSQSHKPVLAFFHYEHCTGCKKTIANTLPKMSVIDYVSDNYVPVMLETTQKADDAELYGIEWTPTFVVMDDHGKEAYRWVGYLPEDDFMGHLNMALATYALKKKDYLNAERLFDEIVLKFPLTEFAPQAAYYLGVVKYRATGDVNCLSKAYIDLKVSYPDSPWTVKASAWEKAYIDSFRKAA
ncbi:MAG: thioredoxin fold domain-containing protein [Nitrospirae bacterium]|nr:thioredoxin fold domain-containing protein [Nitrospirota bacterium]